VLSTSETWEIVGSLNMAVAKKAVVKRAHYISEMSQNCDTYSTAPAINEEGGTAVRLMFGLLPLTSTNILPKRYITALCLAVNVYFCTICDI
jgi:hypothetical protein